MDKLSKLISSLIIQIYLKPRIKILHELNSILENKIKGSKNKMLIFLLSIVTFTLIIPFIIVYPEYTFINKLKWSTYYLLIFSISVLLVSAYNEALLKFNEIDSLNLLNESAETLQNLTFKKNINHKNLSENLIKKNSFECQIQDLIKAISGQIPSKKVAITYTGANGRISYHNLFFTFHYTLENGIANLSLDKRKELLNYITHCFKKSNQQINLKTINQNYIDWIKQKYSERNVNEFLKEFITPIQSV